ncbi:O-antigen ligase family protein [Candidatus Saccharibacteria bacterium]|nr:O-antigen ligase family protein [Candidatus Saccharibacteria bacterium]
MYILPAVLFFSYFPVISLGGSEAMNFELSLPLIWLVVFFAVSVVMMIERGTLLNLFKKRFGWLWLTLPVWASLSVIWSANSLRGMLTAGILWLIFFAGYAVWNLRGVFDVGFKKTFFRWLFISTLVACLWCVVQCVLDLTGVSREYSLICEGCTTQMFGFPHPNGFAIEPQFMGNLLLAPLFVAIWLLLKDKWDCGFSRARGMVLLILISMTLFLTFSRGAIYAFIVGLLFMTGFVLMRAKKKERGIIGKRIGVVWVATVLSFVVALNIQGVMAAVGPTNDAYETGIAKVINHLSLGIIDIRGGTVENSVEKSEENIVENLDENGGKNELDDTDEAVFNGYVAASTDIRVEMNRFALQTWSRDFGTVMFGVGLGGAGQAMYDNGLTGSPKEIVQNQFVSLLLETGVIGALLLALAGVLVVRMLIKNRESGLLLSLSVCYVVSLLFFAGLPNAIQIYLMPVLLWAVFDKANR